MKKRIVVLGGTGRIGNKISEIAIRRGYEVVCLGRSASLENTPLGAIPFQGNVTDNNTILEVIKRADVIILALSIPRKSKSPFASITGPLDLHSSSMELILNALENSNTKRIIKISAQGVGDSRSRTGILFRILVYISNLRFAFKDHERADNMLKKSDLDWTIIRPPILKDDVLDQKIMGGEFLVTRSNSIISRTDLAKWTIDILDDSKWFRRCVTVLAE